MAILFLALAASPGQVQAGGGYELVWGSFGGAHGTASGGGYQLQGQKS